jgi:NodT family efflux transporter outer membrane factor (OMF) lipoprotein
MTGHRRRIRIGMILFALGVVCACQPFRPVQRPSIKTELPSAYSRAANTTPIERWWETFNDSQLNRLIDTALKNNFSIKESWARLEQAGALAIKAGAAGYPTLSADAGASSGRQHTDNGRTADTNTVEKYSLGLLSQYEVDLWGKIRSEREAVSLAASATRFDLQTLAITVAATVTERWIRIISQRMQKQLLEEQLAANQTMAELVELRFRKSLASALDVLQQRQIVERARAQIPLVAQKEALLQNELALLLGKAPHAAPVISCETLDIPPDVPATGIPARLLTARPDIQAAAKRLTSAEWKVAVARADLLPNIQFSARAVYQAGKLNLLLDNWLLNLAAGLTAPLFDGHRRQAEITRSRAVVDEKLAAYRRTVMTAIREVEDALVSEATLRDHIKGLAAQLAATRAAFEEARMRYRKGLNDYLPVLSGLLSVQTLERDLIQRKTDLLVTRINLYRALGGAWVEELEK